MALITTSEKGAMVYGGNQMNALLRGGGIVWKYAPFSPLEYFQTSSGLLSDFGSTAYIWRDSAATSPVTTSGQSIAFALDRSEGAKFSGGAFSGLGSEKVPNPGGPFVNATGWVPGLGSPVVSVEGGQLKIVASTASRVIAEVSGLEAGQQYVVDYSGASGIVAIRWTTNSDGSGSSGTLLVGGLVTAVNTTMYVSLIVTSVGYLSSFSVKKLLGSHASQTGSSFMPQYQPAGTTYDGLDDRMVTILKPTTEGTILARFSGDLASRVVMGSQAASDGRCFLALDASGRLAAGIGGQSTSTIFGGADIRGETHTGAVTWDGSTVKLYLDAVEVYSAAQSGAVNTTIPIMHGALNANGTAAAFFDGAISDALVIDRVLTPQEITQTTNLWSA